MRWAVYHRGRIVRTFPRHMLNEAYAYAFSIGPIAYVEPVE